jgi:hypothetical protein
MKTLEECKDELGTTNYSNNKEIEYYPIDLVNKLCKLYAK